MTMYITDKDVIFVKNNYPASVTEEIMHYVIWSWNRTLSNEEALQIVKESFSNDKFEYQMLKKGLHDRKSVNGIPHIHFFIREKSE